MQKKIGKVIAMQTLVIVVLPTQAVSGATVVVFLRMTKSLVQVESHHVKIALEEIQVVSTRVNNMQLEIHIRMIVIRAHAIEVERYLARNTIVQIKEILIGILVLIRIAERTNFALLTMALLNVEMILVNQWIVLLAKYVRQTLTIVLRNALVLPLASMKAAHIMKEIRSLAKMDVILVLALLDKSLARKTHVDAIMKEIHTMKETRSIVPMDVILVLALMVK
jgi:hypothetical protein